MANEMKLELNDYSTFWFQRKECQNYIIKFEEITDLHNNVLEFLNQSTNVNASKKSQNPPNLEYLIKAVSEVKIFYRTFRREKSYF